MIRRIRPNRRRGPSARPRRLQKRTLVRILTGLTLLAALAGAGWYGWQRVGPDLLARADRVFVIKAVDITGTQRITREEVLALLDLPPGRGLLLTDPTVAQRSLEAHPWIRRVTVRRVFPETLAVEVQEREPVAVLKTAVRDFLVDYEGVLLAASSAQEAAALPALRGVEYVDAVFRDPQTAERVQTGIALAGLLGQAVGRPAVVDLGTPGEFVAYDAGFRLRFGDGQFGDKVDRYRQVSERVRERWGDREGAAPVRQVEVDLRFRDKVIVREGR